MSKGFVWLSLATVSCDNANEHSIFIRVEDRKSLVNLSDDVLV
jgi:hypothetical protein